MEFNLFACPSSYGRNNGPWRVQDVVSRLMKPMQSRDNMDFTLSLDSSPPAEENGIPRILGYCDLCLTNETPLWRGGPNGPKTLCNACGLRYSKELKKVKLVLGEKPKAKKAQGGEHLTLEDEPLANIAPGDEPSADLALGGEPSAKPALGDKKSAGPKTKKAEKKKSASKKQSV